MTESELQAAILDLAGALDWLRMHTRPAIVGTSSNGDDRWATPLSGDPGAPDLWLAHPKRGIVFAELKNQSTRPTGDQKHWLAVLHSAGAGSGWGPVGVYLWRPQDWHAGDIQRVLLLGPDKVGRSNLGRTR